MSSGTTTKRFIPKYYIAEAEDVVFSLPEYDYDEKLEFLLKRIRETYDFDVELEIVQGALDKALATF